MPPSYLNSSVLPLGRSSTSVMWTPLFRNASSRSRLASVSKTKSVVSLKIVLSGLKWIRVPRCGRRALLLDRHLRDALLAAEEPLAAVAPHGRVQELRDARSRPRRRRRGGRPRRCRTCCRTCRPRGGCRARPRARTSPPPGACPTGMPRPSSVTDREPSGWMRTWMVFAWPGHRLVDRVVDDFVDEVVEAARPGVADEHAGALADGLQALEDLDVLRRRTARPVLRVSVMVPSARAEAPSFRPPTKKGCPLSPRASLPGTPFTLRARTSAPRSGAPGTPSAAAPGSPPSGTTGSPAGAPTSRS